MRCQGPLYGFASVSTGSRREPRTEPTLTARATAPSPSLTLASRPTPSPSARSGTGGRPADRGSPVGAPGARACRGSREVAYYQAGPADSGLSRCLHESLSSPVKGILMSSPSAGLPAPEGPGSVSGAPHLPAAFTDTFHRTSSARPSRSRSPSSRSAERRAGVNLPDKGWNPPRTTCRPWSSPGAGHWVAEQAPEEMLAGADRVLTPYRGGRESTERRPR